jgi:hypothetical protein
MVSALSVGDAELLAVEFQPVGLQLASPSGSMLRTYLILLKLNRKAWGSKIYNSLH